MPVNKIKVFILLFFLFLIAGCSNQANYLKDTRQYPLSVAIAQNPGCQQIMRNTPVYAEFIIDNKSEDYIVIRNIDIAGQLPDPVRWYGALYGTTEYNKKSDTWLYNGTKQILSDPVFSSGIIAPGEGFKFLRWVILNNKDVELRLTYQKLTKQEAYRHLYFHRPMAESGQQKEFSRVNNPDGLKNKIDWSLVIFPEPEQFCVHAQSLRCRAELKDRVFGLEMAKKKINNHVLEAVYWQKMKSWVLKTRKNVYLVSKEKTTGLGDIDLLVFSVLESQQKPKFILPLSGYEKFKPQAPKLEYPGYFNPGTTEIPEEKIIELFEFAQKKQDSIKILQYEPNGLGKNTYILVGDFQEIKRKEIALAHKFK